jgi:hypothetical protein
MASKLSAAIGGTTNSDSSEGHSPIVEYKIKVEDDKRGVPTLYVLAKRADGFGSKFQNLILWLDNPGAARAFRAALPQLALVLDDVDSKQVALGEWPTNPQAAAQIAKATAAAPVQTPAPPKSKLSAAFDDLPL